MATKRTTKKVAVKKAAPSPSNTLKTTKLVWVTGKKANG